MHRTPMNARAMGKRQQAALTRCSGKSINQLSKMDAFHLEEVIEHVVQATTQL